jgi:hypothetical protein
MIPKDDDAPDIYFEELDTVRPPTVRLARQARNVFQLSGGSVSNAAVTGLAQPIALGARDRRDRSTRSGSG